MWNMIEVDTWYNNLSCTPFSLHPIIFLVTLVSIPLESLKILTTLFSNECIKGIYDSVETNYQFIRWIPEKKG